MLLVSINIVKNKNKKMGKMFLKLFLTMVRKREKAVKLWQEREKETVKSLRHITTFWPNFKYVNLHYQ